VKHGVVVKALHTYEKVRLLVCVDEGSYRDGYGLLRTTQPFMEMVRAFYKGTESSTVGNLSITLPLGGNIRDAEF
jgi:hypothetical protein